MPDDKLKLDYLELVTIKQSLEFTQKSNNELNLKELITKIDEAIKQWI